jgi:hypothetical protein
MRLKCSLKFTREQEQPHIILYVEHAEQGSLIDLLPVSLCLDAAPKTDALQMIGLREHIEKCYLVQLVPPFY